MSELIAVSNRHLCVGDFCTRIKSIAEYGINIILREKDLCAAEYAELLRAVGSERIIPHTFISTARKLGYKRIHLPLPVFEKNSQAVSEFEVSTSVHSLKQLKKAETIGAVAVTAGHVFNTDCKSGIPGRGLDFVHEIKSAANVPVYAIGGITPDNAAEVLDAGADGVCVMSGFMRCGNISEYISSFKNIIDR